MKTPRRAMAQTNLSIGRRLRALAVEHDEARSLGDDAKLFALTFLGGFLFVSVYLA